jgi:quinol monooxygenase YgiN
MIVEYIRYEIAENRRTDFEDSYRRAAVPLASAPECVDYELTRCEEDPNSYILRIRWTSTQAHINGFREGPAFAEFFTAIRDFVSDIKEMRHYELIGIQGKGGAE